MRMIERRQYLSLALETREPVRVGRKICRKQLQRHITVKLQVAGTEDLAHSTLAQLFSDSIARHSLADNEE